MLSLGVSLTAGTQNNEACKEYVEIPVSGGEEKHYMYMAMNTTK